MTALARYTLRRVARPPRALARPARSRRSTTRCCAERAPERFATVVLARLEPRGGGRARPAVACGGHPPPIVLRARRRGGAGARPAGTLLGVDDAATLDDRASTLGPGDALVLYTDGVTEARRDRAAVAGRPRGAAAPPARGGAAGRSPTRSCDLADGGAAAAPLRDDVAIVALRLTACP